MISGMISGQRLWKYREQVEEVRRRKVDSHLQLTYKVKGYTQSPVKTYYLKQPLDHFNALSKVKYRFFKFSPIKYLYKII